jgi:hypothetical protein
MTCDDDSTRSRLFTLLDEIRFRKTFPFVCCPELSRKVIIAHATGIDDGIRGQHILAKGRISKDDLDGRQMGGRTAAPRAAFCAAPPAT